MDWFDIGGSNRVKVITEQVYCGIKCTWVENKGWKISFDTIEYLFPTFQDAKFAIDRIHEDCVKKYGGVKLKSQHTND